METGRREKIWKYLRSESLGSGVGTGGFHGNSEVCDQTEGLLDEV